MFGVSDCGLPESSVDLGPNVCLCQESGVYFSYRYLSVVGQSSRPFFKLLASHLRIRCIQHT